jgi:hypothetical protein
LNKTELTQVIRAYRRDAGGDWQPVTVPAPPAVTPRSPLNRQTVLRAVAAVLLPVLLGASIWYGVNSLQAAPPQAEPIARRVTPIPTPGRVGVTAPPTAGPQQRLLSRDCAYPTAPQGTIIRGYYTDPSGRPRDAVCRADGWKAID